MFISGGKGRGGGNVKEVKQTIKQQHRKVFPGVEGKEQRENERGNYRRDNL